MTTRPAPHPVALLCGSLFGRDGASRRVCRESRVKALRHGAFMVLLGSGLTWIGSWMAACPADASSLAPSIKVRDTGVLAALGESIPGQIKKAGGVDRYAAAIEAMKAESEQQRDQWRKTAQGSYGGGGNALAWPNGCSLPASGTYATRWRPIR